MPNHSCDKVWGLFVERKIPPWVSYGAVNGRQQSFHLIIIWISSFSSLHHIFIATYGPTRRPWKGFCVFRPEFRFRPNNSRLCLLKVRASSPSEYGMRAGQPLGVSSKRGWLFAILVPSYLCFPAHVPGTYWTPGKCSWNRWLTYHLICSFHYFPIM